jgi:hypothetical protein
MRKKLLPFGGRLAIGETGDEVLEIAGAPEVALETRCHCTGTSSALMSVENRPMSPMRM